MDNILANEKTIFSGRMSEPSGVNLRESAQLELLNELSRYYPEMPFSDDPTPGLRYYFNNEVFCYSDAIVLYCMLRHYKPTRIIEVGSGFSSAVMMDTNDAFLGGATKFTFIEPDPARLFRLLRKNDTNQCRIIKKLVQEVDLHEFEELQSGDFLFIDSSHVAKVGSDVVRVMFDIIPRLNPGVIVHFHDILWPFEYTKNWLLEGRAWNEAYFLRAFLQYNDEFQVQYFNSFIGATHSELLGQKMPLCLKNTGGSLWIRRKS